MQYIDSCIFDFFTSIFKCYKHLLEAEAAALWPPDENWLLWKDPDAGKDWRREEKGTTEDEMVGWHHWLNRYESE